ncbi:MAG: T9SS type A sorting domain-containing protein, partial [Melioribacteraceae bacterium]|nr:T9SS type A sorting domain-containing protein [Melioribacteraceae bacterium]
NIELSPPVIVTATNTEISGTAGPNQVIEIFADSANEGQVFIDSTVSDASGNFSITLSSLPNLPNITATARDALGNTSEFSSPMIITDLDNAEDNIPIEYTLNQNYPNPFNPSTIISYQIPSCGHVSLKIYDILGNEIETLISKKQSAGKYEIVFDAKNISSGVYFYRLKTENYTITKKMIYLE